MVIVIFDNRNRTFKTNTNKQIPILIEMAAAHDDTTTMTTINDFKTVVTEQLEVIVRKIATHIGLGKDEDMKSLQSLVLEHIEETDFEALEKSIKKK